MKKFLRTSDLAKAGQLSVQAIRNYEVWHILPPAERSAKGYRLYTSQHLQALIVTKRLIAGYGWRCATNIMQFIHAGNLPSALAIIDARHAEIHSSRGEIEEALRILRTTLPVAPIKLDRNTFTQKHGLYVHEAAKIFGLRVSALRYWEEQALLQPKRDAANHYRIYDAEQLRRLQFIVLLRKAKYSIETIRYVLDQLATDSPEQALKAAENRLQELTDLSYHCMQATAELWKYIADTQLFNTD